VLVIPEGVGDSEGYGVAFVCLFLDGCHCYFHNHHGFESKSQIVKLLSYLLQECEGKLIPRWGLYSLGPGTWEGCEMMLAKSSDPELSVVVSLHCGLVWIPCVSLHCGLVLKTHYLYFFSIEFHSGIFACLSSSGVRGHRLRPSMNHRHREFPLST